MIRKSGTCSKCKENKIIHVDTLCRKCYDYKYRDRIKKNSTEWRKNNPEKLRISRDKNRFGISRDIVLERDNWQCQKCGMTQEAHFVIFNRSLDMHHIDGEGRGKQDPNNDFDNIISLCTRCHTKLHNDIMAEERWGELVDQDDSKWKYPKIREIVDNKRKSLGTLAKAKQELADELEVKFYTIDHKYYDRKEGFLTEIQKRKNKHNALSTKGETQGEKS